MMPTPQRCPKCGVIFEGSDAIGGLCMYCEVNREIRIQQERVEEIAQLQTKLAAANTLIEKILNDNPKLAQSIAIYDEVQKHLLESKTACSSPNSPKSPPGSTVSDPEPPLEI